MEFLQYQKWYINRIDLFNFGGGAVEHAAFGKVVAALRKEQIRLANGHNWSQRDLADETGLTTRIIGKIERGEQARLDGDILNSLVW